MEGRLRKERDKQKWVWGAGTAGDLNSGPGTCCGMHMHTHTLKYMDSFKIYNKPCEENR